MRKQSWHIAFLLGYTFFIIGVGSAAYCGVREHVPYLPSRGHSNSRDLAGCSQLLSDCVDDEKEAHYLPGLRFRLLS